MAGTSLWCDARRAQAMCFVSHAQHGRQIAHHQLLATPATLALLGTEVARAPGHLPVPYRKRFTVGAMQLDLLPNGQGLGTAALYAMWQGRMVAYLGRPRLVANIWGQAAELRAADAVCIDIGDGLREASAPVATAAQLVARVAERVAAAGAGNGRGPIAVTCPSLLAVYELGQGLINDGVAVYAPPRLRRPSLVGGPVWVAAAREAAVKISLAPAGAMSSAGTTASHDISIGGGAGAGWRAAWPNALSLAELREAIEQTKAREVYLTGTDARTVEAVAAALGRGVLALAPPWQTSLFS